MSKPARLCANCKTERYRIRRTGYCDRCSPLIAQKRQVERWDLNDPSTLKRLPIIAYQFPRDFPKIKAEKLTELEYRLFRLKVNEEKRNRPTVGMDIERALRRLAEYCGGKEESVSNIATEVTTYFGLEQRKILLGWLLDIEESIRWNPKDHWHVLHPEEAAKMATQHLEESVDVTTKKWKAIKNRN